MRLIETPYLLEKKEKHIQKILKLDHVFLANIQLKQGERIPEHDSKKEVFIVVRQGSVLFNTEGVETVVTQNNILHLAPGEMHHLLALVDTDILVFQITP